MADPIAEAFIRIRPDFTGFDTDVRKKIDSAVGGVKLSPASQANVASQIFGTGFKSASKTQLSGMVLGTDFSEQAQRTLAQKLFGPGFRDESGRAIQGALSGLGGGQLAAQFAFFGPGGAALAVLGGAFLVSAKNAATFEQSLSVLQATAQLTDAELQQFADTAKQLGADVTLPAVTAQSAADAMTELAKAGLSAADSLTAVRGVLQLATAANTDAGTAARISAAALNAFSLAGTEAVHVADLLAGASVAAQGDIGDMALALQQSALVANQAGLSIEQLVGLITELAQKGLVGSDAGTSIRTALLRLIPTTKEAAQIMQVLGIEIDKTRTLGQQLPELLDQYQAAFRRLTPTTRQAALQQIAGTDAIRSLTAAIEGGSVGLQRSIDLANRQGAANELATARTKGLAGQIEALKSSTQTLSITLGGFVIGPLADFVGALQETVTGVEDVIQAFDGMVAAIPALGGETKKAEAAFVSIIEQNERAKHSLRDVFDPRESNIGEFIKGINDAGERLRAALQVFREFPLVSPEHAVELQLIENSMGLAARQTAEFEFKVRDLNKELTSLGTSRARRIEIQVELGNLETLAGQLLGATAEADILKGAIQGLNDALAGAGPREKILIITQIVELERRLAGLPAKAQAAAKGVFDPFKGTAFEGAFTPPIDKLLSDLEKIPGAVQKQVGIPFRTEAFNLGQQLTAAFRSLADPSVGAQAKEVTKELAQSLIAELAALGPEGEATLRVVGQRLAKGLAAGITDEEQRAINAARATLEKVRREGEKQVIEAIRSARSNLETLGQTIGEDLAEIIDVGPIGEAIKKIEDELDALQERVSRRQLRFDLTQAQTDLREAQEAIAQVGQLTPAQKKSQEEFLAPFVQKVGDAKAAVKEFDLTEQVAQLEDTRDAAIKAADEGVQKLVAQFEAGTLSAAEFERMLRNQLGPALNVLESEAGQNLGLVFTRDFKREVAALIEQVEALAGFLPFGAGTTPGPQAVRPSATQAEVNARIAESAASLAQIQKDALVLSKEEQDKMTITNGLLRRIARALEGTPRAGGRQPSVRGGD